MGNLTAKVISTLHFFQSEKFFVILFVTIYNFFSFSLGGVCMEAKLLEKEPYVNLSRELNAHPLQSYAWGELKKPAWSPIRLGVCNGDEAISLLTILTRRIPLLGKKFGYIPRGIAVKDGKNLEEVVKLIVDYGKTFNLSHLMVDSDLRMELKMKTDLPDSQAGELKIVGAACVKVGFKVSGLQIQPNRTVVLDLSKSEEELLADMRSKHRQYIRKAQKNGVEIRQGSEDDLDAFCKIIEDIAKERGYVLHSREYYKKVWELFSEQGTAKLFIAEKSNEVVGSYLIIFSEVNAYEMYGGCNQEGNQLLANYLMKWESIKYCKHAGKKFYDQWGAEFKYPGLVQFKEGFGGEVVEFPPQYTFVYDKLGYTLYKALNKLNEWRQKVS